LPDGIDAAAASTKFGRGVGGASTMSHGFVQANLRHAQRAAAYARHALEAECQTLITSEARDNALNRAAFKLARFVPSGLLTEAEITEALTRAAERCRKGALTFSESRRPIQSGLRAGLRKGRAPAIEANNAAEAARRSPASERTDEPCAAEVLRRPPGDELRRFMTAAGTVDGLAGPGADLLRSRGLEPDDLAPFDLVRRAPSPESGVHTPWWPRSWSAWGLIVRAYESDGRLASIHGRACDRAVIPKTRWPRGFDAKGLFLADQAGLALLRGDIDETVELDGVLIVEGLTDFLAAAMWAARRAAPVPPTGWKGEPLRAGPRYAVLGVTAGLDVTAVRWPGWLPVTIATDNDAAGDSYAARIEAGLPPRALVGRLDLREVGRG
jgi:hypothetical protein